MTQVKVVSRALALVAALFVSMYSPRALAFEAGHAHGVCEPATCHEGSCQSCECEEGCECGEPGGCGSECPYSCECCENGTCGKGHCTSGVCHEGGCGEESCANGVCHEGSCGECGGGHTCPPKPE